MSRRHGVHRQHLPSQRPLIPTKEPSSPEPSSSWALSFLARSAGCRDASSARSHARTPSSPLSPPMRAHAATAHLRGRTTKRWRRGSKEHARANGWLRRELRLKNKATSRDSCSLRRFARLTYAISLRGDRRLASDSVTKVLKVLSFSQTRERAGLNLSDAFTREAEIAPNFFQRMIRAFADPEAQAQDALFAL